MNKIAKFCAQATEKFTRVAAKIRAQAAEKFIRATAKIFAISSALFLAILPAHASVKKPSSQPFEPLRELHYDEDLARIGRALYFDINLTPQKLSCNDCHDLNLTGSGSSFAGINTDGELNPPTVLNVANSAVFFGDGQLRFLEDQVRKTLVRQPGVDEKYISQTLQNNADYRRMFERVGLKADFEGAIKALAEFERALITMDADFDDYLRGDFRAISPKAKEGLRLFKNLGCASCHNGVNIGSTVISDAVNNPVCEQQPPRKVPTLRNITLSAPYGPHGEYLNLEDAVRMMVLCQTNTIASDEQIDALMAFLKTLEGKRPRILNNYD